MRFVIRLLACTVCGVLGACAVTSDRGPTESWRGEQPHFSASGFLNGEVVEIAIEGDGAADGTHVWCERDYQAPTVDGAIDLAQAEHVNTTIAAQVTFQGEERVFELELMSHALQSDAPGTALTIVPRVDGVEPDADEIWLEWEWTLVDGEDLLEAAAQEGRFVLEQFTGTPGEGGVVIPEGEGVVAGYADARWSVDERLSISFTVPCVDNEIEEIEDGH